MKVKYIGDYYKAYLEKGKVYEAQLVDNSWYEIFDEDDQESYGYPIEDFEIIKS